ncbi:MAG: GNAT family N-acetyltransferase [Methylophaga sp.]|uniref:GNAT family N-acetyltransferase n=1 Tax=Pseudidiomarina aestuarii TaxID=624146 RepID=A0A2T4CXL9_9GAMM|nr:MULTISPECIES: GNAT family N-acetyltransferase [unclassified Methylophaga]PTB86307.1 GNAT family N-acetyltransferase [Pseudidiomarina aestuarii]MAP25816.1 GNAT family N-acetyltransferase [Methylophaga sp.]MDX1749251.1 GNAT family N-acetyltransferase [Methylophaga sp.]HBX59122.1 GNAT family N-acetyltransferase [Methylophaga sp.]HCN98957.1 GNAT family N-acetyltransferase [Methylophaga sp.]
MLELKRLSGEALNQFIPELARLRIEVFRDFPYLYDGDPDYEARYLQTYIEAPDSVIVLAFDGDKVVGASTGIPLRYETDEVKAPFIKAGIDVDSVFYCGESVLLSQYRGKGAGVAFFEHREQHAQELGGYEFSCFCGVQRPEDHPRRPSGYKPLDNFWRKRGYEKHPELNTTFSWKELDEEHESPKPMTFWMKKL